MYGSHEDRNYRSFIQPQKGPTTQTEFGHLGNSIVGNQSFTMTNNNMSYDINRSRVTDVSQIIEKDYSQGRSEKSLTTLQSKLSQLYRWCNNIQDEIISDRRDLMLLKGKVNSLEINADYHVLSNTRHTKKDMDKVQKEMDKMLQGWRYQNFELAKQIEYEQKTDLQLKKDVNKCQGRIAGCDVEIGKGRVKKFKEQDIMLQTKKQQQMEKTFYTKPNTTYSHMDTTFIEQNYTYQN